MDKTDQTLLSVAMALIIVSAVIFTTIPDKGFFFFIFGAVLLLVIMISCIVLAGIAYSMKGEAGNLSFTGTSSVFNKFCELSEKDVKFLMAVIIILVVILLVLNSISRYVPAFFSG